VCAGCMDLELELELQRARSSQNPSPGNTTWERNGDSDSQQRIWNATRQGTRQRRENIQQNNRTNGDKSVMVPCGAVRMRKVTYPQSTYCKMDGT
jgi:hypothetical protein